MLHTSYKMRHYTRGKTVMYDNRYYTVTHVTLRNGDLFVHLDGILCGILADLVLCEPTVFALTRTSYRGDSGHR